MFYIVFLCYFIAEEEVILWVTSDLVGTTSVQSSEVVETTTVSDSAIPVALISRAHDELAEAHITETTYEECKGEFCVVVWTVIFSYTEFPLHETIQTSQITGCITP